MEQPLRRALQRAGISREEERIGWHDLRQPPRHEGRPAQVIPELMGHATIDMTMRSAHLSPDTCGEAIGVLDRPSAAACDIGATRTEAASNHP
jgi:hypothetical protein